MLKGAGRVHCLDSLILLAIQILYLYAHIHFTANEVYDVPSGNPDPVMLIQTDLLPCVLHQVWLQFALN